jgi:hypothetical protein
MPEFTYHGDDRYYPDLGVSAVDGESHTLDADPDDGRWTSGTGTAITNTPPVAVVPPAPVQTVLAPLEAQAIPAAVETKE